MRLIEVRRITPNISGSLYWIKRRKPVTYLHLSFLLFLFGCNVAKPFKLLWPIIPCHNGLCTLGPSAKIKYYPPPDAFVILFLWTWGWCFTGYLSFSVLSLSHSDQLGHHSETYPASIVMVTFTYGLERHCSTLPLPPFVLFIKTGSIHCVEVLFKENKN